MIERAGEAVGIDLGTTYSSLAYLDPQMIPRVVADSSGQTVMPSVVYFADEEIIAGEMALQQAKLCADRVVQFIKVHMGDMWRKEFLGRVHTPESISAIIIGQLLKEAEPQIGPISTAVITVPAYFTEKRRRATQQAGEIAGLKVIGTLNEPMAATLAYGLHRTNREQFVVVYDLGGGTFDVTVVRISPNKLEELATNGNRQLGGRDWDQAMIDYVVADFQRKFHVDLTLIPQAMQDLLLECERAKRRLGRLAKTSIRVHAEGHDHQVEITRELFEEQTSHLLQATKLTTEVAVRDAGLLWGQIARVVLVGGSTHMPAVRRMLHDLSGKPPDTGINPVVAVALGAAIYAQMLETGHEIQSIHPAEEVATATGESPADPKKAAPPRIPLDSPSIPTVRFVTAHGVGVKVRGRRGLINRVLIPKNTPVPTSVTKTFLTKSVGAGGTDIKIDITQGDTTDLALAEPLGTGRIQGLPRQEPDGQPVEVTMDFSAQGRLNIRAKYVPRNQDMKMSLDIPGGLHEEEVQEHRRFLEETGFFRSSPVEQVIEAIDDDDDADDIPLLEPID
jgi:molecular chaperone DnaK